MVKKLSLLLIVFSITAASLTAQSSVFHHLFSKVDNMLAKMEGSGVDTNYIGVHKHHWSIFVNRYLSDMNLNIISNLDPDFFGRVDIKIDTDPQKQMAIGAYYRGYGFSYSWDTQKGYRKDLSFSTYSSPVGMELRYHKTNMIHGTIHAGILDELYKQGLIPDDTMKINSGAAKVTSFILNAYYLFNTKTFSYSSALTYNTYQKKSAGSFFAGVTIHQQRLSFDDEVLSLMAQLNSVRSRQLSLGLGYAYNWVINPNLLFHSSVLPMLLITDKHGSYAKDWDDKMSKVFGDKTRVTYNYVLRGSLSYRWGHDRFQVGIAGLYNNFRVGKKKSYYVFSDDWTVRTFFCVRF